MAVGAPVISVDGKKKEKVGNFASSGREWQPAGEPVEVNMHDFPDKELGKVTPYGIYDIAANNGWVTVGTSADTAEFVSAGQRGERHTGPANAPRCPANTRRSYPASDHAARPARPPGS
jgi:Rhodopirellula transposase DDE domain